MVMMEWFNAGENDTFAVFVSASSFNFGYTSINKRANTSYFLISHHSILEYENLTITLF